MRTTRLWVAGAAVLLVLLLAPVRLRADEGQEKAVQAVEKLRGKVTRDEGSHRQAGD